MPPQGRLPVHRFLKLFNLTSSPPSAAWLVGQKKPKGRLNWAAVQQKSPSWESFGCREQVKPYFCTPTTPPKLRRPKLLAPVSQPLKIVLLSEAGEALSLHTHHPANSCLPWFRSPPSCSVAHRSQCGHRCAVRGRFDGV